jgi:glutamate---cysteine ligase / carboxylate-amine ligase
MARPALLPLASCSSNFGSSPPFTLGVEEELFLVDPRTDRVSRVTDAVLARRPRFVRGRVLGEMCDGVVELATPVCTHAVEAADRLRDLRAAVLRVGVAELLGAGVHPTTLHGDVRHRASPHYDAVAADTRSLLRQSAYCGVHVHVGMPDPETAIAAFNGMRKWIPLLQALSANSPYWYGKDSGLAGSRTVLCHSVPRTGLPDAFGDWSDYERTVTELLRAGEHDDVNSIWWDMRPHPELGTLEIRALDGQSSLEDLEGLVALIHGLVQHEALVADGDHPSKALLDEATFRAIRDGLEARIAVGGRIRHVQDLARQALDIASPYAARLGCSASLQHVERLLSDGNGATRQRAAHAVGGMPAVLHHLVDETCEKAGRDGRRSSRVTPARRLSVPA